MSGIEILLILAIVPGLFLMYKVYQMDQVEKEPMGLLVKLFLLGALSIIPAVILELVGMMLLGTVLGEYSLIYVVLENFLVVALAEEGSKYFMLKKATWNNREFDYCFDGVVYAVFTGLGFAIFENVQYTLEYGIGTAVIRAITAVPAHTIFAVFMGYFYGQAKMAEVRGYLDASRRYKQRALWIPVILHGFYDFAASIDSGIFTLIFWVFILGMERFTIKKIKQFSANDQGMYY